MTGDCPVMPVVKTVAAEETAVNGTCSSNSPASPAGAAAGSTGVKHHRHRHKLKHRYRFEKTLGKGTYGKVKLATEISTGNQYAIKSIPKNKVEDPEDMRRIRQEIELMSTLDHPNIVNIYEVFESKEKIVIVMEYASGGELYEFIDSHSIPVGEIQRLFRQIVSALAYCHLNNIVHRDLKLENVLLDQDGDAKIADFGLSSYYTDDDLLHTFCGSPLYASPEIVHGQPYHGPEVDCWSLGVILYAMVYKTMPFGGDDFNQLKKQIMEGRYYDPCPGTVQSQLIRHLLSVDPRYRATIYDVAHHPWVFGDDADEVLTMQLAASMSHQTLDTPKEERGSTESSDAESESKPVVKPTGILKGVSSPKEREAVAVEEPVAQWSLGEVSPVTEVPSVFDGRVDSDSDSQEGPTILQAKGLPQQAPQGVIQNETDSFLSLASSTATLPSNNSSAIFDQGSPGSSSPPVDVVKRRHDSGKQLRVQRPSGVDALFDDLPSPRTLAEQITGEDQNLESSSEEKRSSVRLSKRISCGKYSKITELWESIFNESHVQALISAKSQVKLPKSEDGSGSSSSEDLLEILNSKQLKKSYSSSFKLTRHRFAGQRRSMRTHREVIMEAHQLQFHSESLFEKAEFHKGARDSGLGDDIENIAKIYQKALEISATNAN